MMDGINYLAQHRRTLWAELCSRTTSDMGPAFQFGSNIETDQHFFHVGQIADDALEWFRQLADQGRNGDDLMPLGQRWICHQIDDFDFVAASRGAVRKFSLGLRWQQWISASVPPHKGEDCIRPVPSFLHPIAASALAGLIWRRIWPDGVAWRLDAIAIRSAASRSSRSTTCSLRDAPLLASCACRSAICAVISRRLRSTSRERRSISCWRALAARLCPLLLARDAPIRSARPRVRCTPRAI